jgi:hypothetical protein
MRTDSFSWTFTSTGSGVFHDTRGINERTTFYVQTNATSTASVVFEQAASTGSTDAAGTLGPSTGLAQISTGTLRTFSVSTQAVRAVRPRVTAMSTGGVRVDLVGTGQW